MIILATLLILTKLGSYEADHDVHQIADEDNDYKVEAERLGMIYIM